MENSVASFYLKPVPTTEVTRTYLEMRDPSELQGARSDDARIRIEQMPECPASFFRYLYVEVGRNYHWIDRLPWTRLGHCQTFAATRKFVVANDLRWRNGWIL